MQSSTLVAKRRFVPRSRSPSRTRTAPIAAPSPRRAMSVVAVAGRVVVAPIRKRSRRASRECREQKAKPLSRTAIAATPETRATVERNRPRSKRDRPILNAAADHLGGVRLTDTDNNQPKDNDVYS